MFAAELAATKTLSASLAGAATTSNEGDLY
jgi:hypothetical protein